MKHTFLLFFPPLQNNNSAYPQCFILSSKLVNVHSLTFLPLNSEGAQPPDGLFQRVPASETREPCPVKNPKNALKSSERGPCHFSRIPAGISRASSVNQRSGLGNRVAVSFLPAWNLNSLHSFPGLPCALSDSALFTFALVCEKMGWCSG